MKKKILIICLILFVLCSLIAGVFFFLDSDFPVWLCFYIISGLAGVSLIAWIVITIIQKKREKKFIDEILVEDEELSNEEKQYVSELKDCWKTAIKDLKSSHLKTVGNPLYVLPWYMVIGESGTGKTTAIKNSRLTANFAEPNKLSGFSGTKNCDWWFFEKAIVLDTAGRYAIYESERRDKDEWHTFLQHLVKYRKKEPVNGLVVTISADKLLTADKKIIEDDGKKIRNRLEELMFFLGAKCPIHILVTKCDLIHGMTNFCKSLPEETLTQSFGYLNTDMDSDADSFLEKAFSNVCHKLKEIRLLISYKPGQKRIMPDVLLFPEEFERLKPGLEVFYKSAFQQNVYQEAALIRGIYFTSALQEGLPISNYIDNMEVAINKEAKQSSGKSYFIHDFFSKILPEDRYLFKPTQKAIEWKKKLSKLSVLCWFLVVLTFCGLLSFSFFKNLNIIRTARALTQNIEMTEGSLYKDISALEDLKLSILDIESKNRHWIFPRFGMNHSLQVEKDLKSRYCRIFAKDYLKTYDERLTERVINIYKSTEKKEISQTIPVVVRRINLIAARLKTAEFDKLHALPQPEYAGFLVKGDEQIIPKAVQMYQSQYLHYVAWANPEVLIKSQQKLMMLLNGFLEKDNISLKWLVYWCNSASDEGKITLSSFWNGSGSLKESVEIPTAFTSAGMTKTESFLDEMSRATNQKLDIEKKKIEYDQWFKSSYILAWYDFGKSFSKGSKLLISQDEKISTAMKIGTADGPYFAFINKMAEELTPFEGYYKEESRQFIPALYEYIDIMDAARVMSIDVDSSKKTGSKLGSFLARKTKVGRSVGKIQRLAGKKGGKTAVDNPKSQELFEAAAMAFNTYKKSLSQMAESTLSKQTAYSFTKTAFAEDPAVGTSPVYTSLQSIQRLTQAEGDFKSPEKMMYDLIKGPQTYLWALLCEQTGCYLQDKWEETVLMEIDGITNQQILEKLLWEEDGYAKNFMTTFTKVYMERNRKKGYFPKKIDSNSIKLTDSFFNFFKRRDTARKIVLKKYVVKFDGLPTESNPSARIFPHLTKLELECDGGIQSMKNYNFPRSRTFTWQPGECGTVNLYIYVGDLKLKKTYTGYYAFAKFLNDFKRGYKTFYRDDFPEASNDLKRVGIEFIKVKYRITGSRPIINLMNLGSGRTPKVVVSCSE
ncbi:MAG: hypothetical protein GY710_07590 [Desulfobacteraceae bacterium]|nr:hypothetical protein [Desulfobacteraceae bacterium]